MLWTVAAIFAVCWLLGVVTSVTAGGLIHVLIVTAVVMLVVAWARLRGAESRARLAVRGQAEPSGRRSYRIGGER